MTGILVHGDNHFIVEGPRPNETEAESLAQTWSLIQLGPFPETPGWRIINKAFRENLEWAVVVPAASAQSEAVRTLLAELAARGVHP